LLIVLDALLDERSVTRIAIESREATQLRHWPREFGASAT
jgi:hypothetical protein